MSQAQRLGVCGARFNGDEACAWVWCISSNRTSELLDDRLADVLRQIRRCAPRANTETKRIMLAVGQRDLGAILDDAAANFSAAMRGPEAAEGTRAFIEKRLPNWAGQ